MALLGAFAQVPKLPKMLHEEILETLVEGSRQGFFVLRQARPDKSFRTIWRQDVSVDDIQKDPSWEVVLPEAAQLEEISASQLTPGGLPELWSAAKQIAVSDAVNYFAGSKYVTTKREATDGTLYDVSADSLGEERSGQGSREGGGGSRETVAGVRGGEHLRRADSDWGAERHGAAVSATSAH